MLIGQFSFDWFHLKLKNRESRVTTFPRVSEVYEYQRWHHGMGAELTLVMILPDFSKLHLHYRSPRRRSVSRSRSRYEQIFLIFVGNS